MPLLLVKISRVIAFALLSLSILIPWFRVPASIHEGLAGTYKVGFSEPISTIVFKSLVLAIVLIACWLGYRRRLSDSRDWARPITAGGSILVALIGITYPALTMQRCAAVSAHAAWLQAQNYSLIKPNGDTFTAQEYTYQAGQHNVEVKEVLPRAFEVLPAPLVDTFSDLRLARLEDIVNWLGLTQAFCEFVYVGWFSGLIGSLLLAISFARVKVAQDGRFRNLRHRPPGIRLFAILGAFSVSALCLVPVVMAGHELARARVALLEGRFAESLRHTGTAEVWMPALAYHTDLICQRGWLEQRLGLKTSEVQVFSAIREEVEGFRSRAAQHYSDLLEREEPGPVRDEAFRGALRLALKDFNTGLLVAGASRLAQLTAIDPTCIKAYYALQLADLRSFRKDQLESDAAKFEAVTGSFQSHEKSSLIASAHRKVAELEFDYRDLRRLGDEMRSAITP